VRRPLPSVFFRTETGRKSVRDWLKDLPKNEQKIIGEDIMTVQFRWPLHDVSGLVDNLGSGIGKYGFIKKTGRTAREDRALALQRKNAYIKSSKS
jgi:phage-related protein